jgi:hypothetical protein
MKKVLCLLSALILLTATSCKKDTVNTTTDADKKTTSISLNPNPVPKKNALDMQSCAKVVEKYAVETYPKIKEASIMVNNEAEEKYINFIFVTDNDVNSEESLAWANDCVRKVNAEAIKLDGSIKPADENFYGGIFDEYKLIIVVTTENNAVNDAQWDVHQTVKAGTHEPLKLREIVKENDLEEQSEEQRYNNLTNAEKKEICEYIQGRYDDYEAIYGPTGDRFSDSIWKEAQEKYGFSESYITLIWANMYSY